MNIKTLTFLFMVIFLCICGISPAGNTNSQLEVFKPKNSIQCEKNSGVSELSLKKELEDKGIEITSYSLSHDGMLYPTVCGAPTGEIHVFTINKKSLNSAKELGYQKLK